ncbi:MAG: hypothetical protein HZT40_15075 [Candidatus Thiothrix singaporensis]|uniref:Secreted protein n=1 Tax=Candidatus Thiothrix singaporensis TaxID=2799669 RepID=A0A7L6AUQ2_9GAMM|nr:MAG: hypothetical protein HZT40_15075 [Candidatus Thiothrix singaporensis]
MNTKFSTMIASLLMVSALSATAIADNKVDLMEGKGAAQTQEKACLTKPCKKKLPLKRIRQNRNQNLLPKSPSP